VSSGRPRLVLIGRRPLAGQYSIERVFREVAAHLEDRFDVSLVTLSHPSKGVRSRVAAAWEARRHQGDVTHVTGDVHFVALLLDRRRTVLTVHDVELLGRLSAARALVFRWVWLRLPVSRTAAVTVPSEATRAELLRVAGGDPAKVRVVPDVVDPAFRPDPKPFPTRTPTVLIVGTAPNKNLERALAALAPLPVRGLIVGALDRAQRDAIAAAELDVDNRVDLDDEGIAGCYRDCDLLLYVSTTEGFGLPIIEAQATGRPVVTSDRAPLTDVAGPGACFVDPEDVAAIRAGVRRVIDDRAFREQLVAAGLKNVERFRPERVADGYAQVYGDVLSRRAGGRAR
jgi:glycosyltransferase involved in cell wall biosynthesis